MARCLNGINRRDTNPIFCFCRLFFYPLFPRKSCPCMCIFINWCFCGDRLRIQFLHPCAIIITYCNIINCCTFSYTCRLRLCTLSFIKRKLHIWNDERLIWYVSFVINDTAFACNGNMLIAGCTCYNCFYTLVNIMLHCGICCILIHPFEFYVWSIWLTICAFCHKYVRLQSFLVQFAWISCFFAVCSRIVYKVTIRTYCYRCLLKFYRYIINLIYFYSTCSLLAFTFIKFNICTVYWYIKRLLAACAIERCLCFCLVSICPREAFQLNCMSTFCNN